MAALLAVIVALCLCAPLYAHHVAHTNPFRSNLDGTTIVNGKRVPVMVQSTAGLGLGVTPIGPTWDLHHYFLGADEQGRDVAARLLYGGRNSLLIGTSAALITCFLAVLIGVVAGFFGGLVDGVLSRLLDLDLGVPGLPARDQPLDRADRARRLSRARSTSSPEACCCRS